MMDNLAPPSTLLPLKMLMEKDTLTLNRLKVKSLPWKKSRLKLYGKCLHPLCMKEPLRASVISMACIQTWPGKQEPHKQMLMDGSWVFRPNLLWAVGWVPMIHAFGFAAASWGKVLIRRCLSQDISSNNYMPIKHLAIWRRQGSNHFLQPYSQS